MAGRDGRLKQIGTTDSICPECLQVIKAEKNEYEDGIYLEKTCPHHGHFRTLFWEGDADSYQAWGRDIKPADFIPAADRIDKGCPYDCGLCKDHKRRGCCVLLEVTLRCNLRCPVCFAEAGKPGSRDVPIEMLEEQMDYLMSHGGPFNLQISGGEPTMRDDLPEIIRTGRKKGFSFFQLNTNGLRLAGQPGYAEELKEAGLSCVFLQFDGVKDETYQVLRGRKLWEEKQKAIDACGRAGLGVILVPVITPGVNEDQIGEILSYGIRRMPVVRGVHFQPVSYFGRCLKSNGNYRITIPKLLKLMEEQTDGRMRAEHFTGGNATNPYCTFQANYVRQEDGSMSPMIHGTARAYGSSEQARKFVAHQWSGPENLCCCDSAVTETENSCCCGEDTTQMQLDTSSLDKFLADRHNRTFAVSGMLFQDAMNLDLDRLRRCYILETDSRYGMIPFCAYNLTSLKGKTLYR